jgi:hypothetical protein
MPGGRTQDGAESFDGISMEAIIRADSSSKCNIVDFN